MKIDRLETPALILDMDAFESNVESMQRLMEERGLKLRPHYKSHKCTYIAHAQIRAGAKGITCATLGEAKDLVNAGIEDVLIANQITQPSKVAQVAYLAGCCRLTVCVDQAENIEMLEAAAAYEGTTIYCLVELDIGMSRCGVTTFEEFAALAKKIQSCPNLVFEGIQAYAGNLAHERDFEKRKTESAKVEQKLRDLISYLGNEGITVKEVSGTSTGTAQFRPQDSVYTEIQAGSYIFMDTSYGLVGVDYKNSLFVLTQVVSIKEKIITDGGRKNISVDQEMPVFRDFPDAEIKLSEEHCSLANDGYDVKIGDRLLVIPGHCCTTVNLHDSIYLTRDGKVVDKVPITSRGKSV